MRRHPTFRSGIVRSVAAVALCGSLLVACGGDDDDASATTTAPAAAAATTLPPGTISVSLIDVSPTSMSLVPSAKSASAGTITFVVTNNGTREHEFLVLETDIPATDLPVMSNDRVDEEGEGVENLGEIGSVKVGETKTLELDLDAGHYDLICNLVGHVRMGMVSDFDVT
jgi:uncharacterized cupredoxin-like copper-binding protein